MLACRWTIHRPLNKSNEEIIQNHWKAEYCFISFGYLNNLLFRKLVIWNRNKERLQPNAFMSTERYLILHSHKRRTFPCNLTIHVILTLSIFKNKCFDHVILPYLVCWRCLRLRGNQRLQEVENIVGSEPCHRLLLQEIPDDTGCLADWTNFRLAEKQVRIYMYSQLYYFSLFSV